jgi:hypothetical protein
MKPHFEDDPFRPPSGVDWAAVFVILLLFLIAGLILAFAFWLVSTISQKP